MGWVIHTAVKEAVEGKVNGMDEPLQGKPVVEVSGVKPKKVETMEQAQAQPKVDMDPEQKQDSWWSILSYWILELRWRRAFWVKMGRPIIEKTES